MGDLADVQLTFVETLDDLDNFRAWLGQRREWLGADIETTGLNCGRDKVRLMQFGDLDQGWAIPWEDYRGAIKDLLPRYKGRIVFHNAIFDTKFLKREGVHIPQEWCHDTMVMCHLLDPRTSIGLKSAAARYVDRRAWIGKDALSEAFRHGKWDWATVPVDHPSYWLYSALDTVLTAHLAAAIWPKVEPFRKVYEVEMACIHVLRDAGLTGVRIDMPYVEEKRVELLLELEQLSAQIPCEPSKDAQVVKMLQERGAVLTHKTKSGAISVDDEALAEVEPSFPDIVKPLREWRTKSRLVSSYLDNMLSMNVDGILHPSVKPLGARTARMSVTEPALQTLPRGRTIRDAFISREGQTLILADYEQAELRVLASFAHETSMIEAFMRGEDLHRWVASQAYQKTTEEVTKPERQVSKNTQFARVYGAGNAKIALTAGVPVAVIDQFVMRYNQLFPGIPEFTNATIREVLSTQFNGESKCGYVETILGRRLPVEHNKSYVGVNYKVQCSATADLLKLKLVELDAAGLGEFIRLPVHDEIMFEVPDDQLDEVEEVVRRVMPETKLFECPITVDVERTKCWGHKYGWAEN